MAGLHDPLLHSAAERQSFMAAHKERHDEIEGVSSVVKRSGMADKGATGWDSHWDRYRAGVHDYAFPDQCAARFGQPLQTYARSIGEPAPDRRRPLQDGEEDHDGVASGTSDADKDRVLALWAAHIGTVRNAPKGHRLRAKLNLHAFVVGLLANRL